MATGYATTASGYAATSFGEYTIAYGKDSVAMGYLTNVTTYAGLAIGRYNVGGGTFNSWVDSDPLLEIGIGNSTNPMNALTIYKNGDMNQTHGNSYLNLGNATIDVNDLNADNPSESTTVGNIVGVGSSGEFRYLVGDLIERINLTTGLQSTTSSTVWSLLSNLSLTLSNARKYLVKCEMIEYAASASTGVKLRTNTTGSPSLVRTTYTKMATTSAMETFSGTNTASNSYSATGSSTTASVAWLNSIVITAGSASAWTVELESEVGGSAANIEAGSYCMAVKIG